MSDGWVDVASGLCEPDYQRQTPVRLVIKLIVLYIVFAAVCWGESLFRRHGIELEATVETVGAGPKGDRRIRYHFRDPVTGMARMNTVSVREDLAPRGQTALIEYIPGDVPSSRLKIQARPYVISVFFWLNVVLLSAIGGLLGYIAWEANRPIARSSERRNGRLRLRLAAKSARRS